MAHLTRKSRIVSIAAWWLGCAALLAAAPADDPADEAKYTAALHACADCPELAAILNHLGGIYHTQGLYLKAEPLYLRALKNRETQDGLASPPLLPALNNLALLYRDLADYRRARELAERAVAIVEMNHAGATAEGSSSYASLGAILEVQGQIPEAEQRLQQALTIREGLFGKDDVSVADVLSDLALARRSQGDLGHAIGLYRRALAIYESSPQPSRNVSTTLNNLGQALVQKGEFKEAEASFRRAIADAERRYGPQHPNVSAALTNLASLLASRRRFQEAEADLRRAEEIDRQSFSPDHPRMAHDFSLEASLAFERKRYERAERLLNDASAILSKHLPANHPDIGVLQAGLGEIYLRQGRRAEAETAFAAALSILEPAWGSESPQLLPTLQQYARLLRARQEYAAAAGIDARVMKIQVTQALKRAA